MFACLPLLDEAAGAGLLTATASPGERRFSHDLVRDAVEAGLDMTERVRLHRRTAAVIEEVYAGQIDVHLFDLARHWTVAELTGERARAADWITRAAEEAVRRLAYEEAARLYRLALDVGAQDVGGAERCRLLLSLGGALKLAGELPDRVEACREAAEIAGRVGRPAGRGGGDVGGRRVRRRVRAGAAPALRGGSDCAASRADRAEQDPVVTADEARPAMGLASLWTPLAGVRASVSQCCGPASDTPPSPTYACSPQGSTPTTRRADAAQPPPALQPMSTSPTGRTPSTTSCAARPHQTSRRTDSDLSGRRSSTGAVFASIPFAVYFDSTARGTRMTKVDGALAPVVLHDNRHVEGDYSGHAPCVRTNRR